MSVKPIPDGYRTITPYLTVREADRLIDFMKAAFDAEVKAKHVGPEGRVLNAEIKIGDSMLMIGEAHGDHGPIPTQLYLYVKDTDALYRRAMNAGATSLMEPADQFYGDRNAGVKDFAGNYWWIATHIEDVTVEEIERRAAAHAKS